MKSKRDKSFVVVAKILKIAQPTLIVDITILLKFLLKPELIKKKPI